MLDLLTTPAFWGALFSVSLIQVALGADNLIIITILAGKLPVKQRPRAVQLGLILAMLFRILLLAVVSWLLKVATSDLFDIDTHLFGAHLHAGVTGKALVLVVGGLVLIWKGIKELRVKAKGVNEQQIGAKGSFGEVVAVIVAMNLLFSVDSILTVVGMTDIFLVMIGSVVISVGLMLAFAEPIARFVHENPDFEILGLFIMLLIGFVLMLEGGHVAHLTLDDEATPYIPQWIVIFILALMFAVDFYQNWLDKRRGRLMTPVALHHRKK